ncbi:MAG TPA: glycosyltransferase [Candidatus Angelobacter sp.]|nr:glycosyltransferase [Candidatus Angelobacter sp.]
MTPDERRGNHRILYVAYPLLTVAKESAGGAEQVLWTLEREMARQGDETTVAASAGSRVAGELFATGEPCHRPDDFARRDREHQEKVVELVRRRAAEGRPFDLVHDHSGSFWPRAGEFDLPCLGTLHLPRAFYPPRHFENVPANVGFSCVSPSQARGFADLGALEGVVANGVALDLLEPDERPNHARRNGLLWLGRICEEKAPHLALEIAARARLPLMLAGQVYPFTYHQRYFDNEVAPRLRELPDASFAALPSFGRKRQLLSEARAVLVTSLAEETSSLVAMEAAASATPVIAFARGALPQIVCHGVTGFLVDTVEDAIRAIERISEIDHEACLRHAREHFSATVMAENYGRLYKRILALRPHRVEPSATR